MKTTTKSEQNLAIEASAEVIASSKDINNFLSASNQVKAVFHTHYANMETGEYGISDLLAKILEENGAVFPKSAANRFKDEAETIPNPFFPIAMAGSMFIDDIAKQVATHFTAGSIRYPLATIKTYLSVFMAKKGLVGKIQLKGDEDQGRKSAKPRAKYFLIQ